MPAPLDRFEADPAGTASELIDHLCPQLDTAFPASFAALPRPAALAVTGTDHDRFDVLMAAGSIVSCATTGGEVFEVFEVFATTDEHARDGTGKTPLHPAAPAEPDGLADRLHARARTDTRPSLAHRLRHLFGPAACPAACPDCGTAFRTADRVAAYSTY
ncbi:hypothetical protein [Kitasatospora sp. NPDC004272]